MGRILTLIYTCIYIYRERERESKKISNVTKECNFVHFFSLELEKCLLSEIGEVRLAGLNSSYIGYVQICKDGFWASVSYEDEEEWTKKNSIVTCKELGFLGSVRIMNKEGYGEIIK